MSELAPIKEKGKALSENKKGEIGRASEGKSVSAIV